MRKAVPVALVLIAGAAVVLWFGNRLNSWVLGGLIGGLASVLLSIPISLALFAYFARQHAEYEQYTQQVFHKRLLPHRSTDYLPDEIDADYYDDDYQDDGLVDGEISAILEEDEGYGPPILPTRQLPSTASSRRATGNVSGRHLSTTYGMQQQRVAPAGQQGSTREEKARGRRTTRRISYPGLPSSQQDPFRSRFRSNALHTARLEAAQRNMDEDDDYEVR